MSENNGIDERNKNHNNNKSDEGNSYSFEEALEMTGIGRYNYLVFIVSSFSLVAAGVEIFSVGITVNAAKCDLDLDVYKTGLIGSVPMIGVVISAHLWGYVADTRGRKFTLAITMLGSVIFAVIGSLSNHWIMMTISKLISAAFSSGTNAVINALLGETTPQSVRNKYLIFAATALMSIQIIISLLTYPILKMDFSYYLPLLDYHYRPWRLLATIFGSLSIINFLLLRFFVMESPKYYFAKGHNEKGLEILSKMFVRNSGKPADDYRVKSVILNEKVVTDENVNVFVSMWHQTAPLFNRDNWKNTAIIGYMSIVTYSVGPAFIVWMPLIFDAYSKDTTTKLNFCQLFSNSTQSKDEIISIDETCDDSISDFTLLALCALGLYLLITYYVSMMLVRFTGKKWMFIAIHVMGACLCWSINHVYNIGGIVMFLGIISSVNGIGIVTAYAVELYPTYLRAMGVCITVMIGRAFSFITINLIGPQLESNCDNFVLILGAFIFSGALVTLTLPGGKSQKDVKKQCDQA